MLSVTSAGSVQEAMAPVADDAINSELHDEIEAINAIYGDSTLSVTTSHISDIFILLNLDDWAYSLELCFPVAYPLQEPRVTGVDALWMASRPMDKVQRSSLERILQQVFTPGSVCVFDALETLRASLGPQSTSLSDPTTADTQSWDLPIEYLNNVKPPAVIDNLEALSQCAACLEQAKLMDLANLSCQLSRLLAK